MALNRRAAKWAMAGMSVAVALLAAEGIWRLFFPRPGFAPRSELSAPGMVVPHPSRGYTIAPGWSGRMKGTEFDVGFRTDALGCRIPQHVGEGCDPSHLCTILALGDSFTFGHGLEEEQAWPELMARRLESRPGMSRICLVNGAVSGYNMAQVRDRAAELAPQIHPELIVLGVFVNGAERMKNPYALYEGDVVRDHERPRLRAVEGGFLHTPMNRPALRSVHFWLGEHFFVGAALLEQSYRLFGWMSNAPGHYWRSRRGVDEAGSRGPTEEGERAYLAPMLAQVDEIDALARSAGARLVVLVIHVQREDGTFREIDERFSRIVVEHADRHAIPVYDPTPLLKERARGAPVFRYSLGDAHWSAAAHALVAEDLADFLVREALVPTACGGPDAARSLALAR